MRPQNSHDTPPISHGNRVVFATTCAGRVNTWPAADLAAQGISVRDVRLAAGVTSQQMSHYKAGRFSQISRSSRRRITDTLIAMGITSHVSHLVERRTRLNARRYAEFHRTALRCDGSVCPAMSTAALRAHIMATEIFP